MKAGNYLGEKTPPKELQLPVRRIPTRLRVDRPSPLFPRPSNSFSYEFPRRHSTAATITSETAQQRWLPTPFERQPSMPMELTCPSPPRVASNPSPNTILGSASNAQQPEMGINQTLFSIWAIMITTVYDCRPQVHYFLACSIYIFFIFLKERGLPIDSTNVHCGAEMPIRKPPPLLLFGRKSTFSGSTFDTEQPFKILGPLPTLGLETPVIGASLDELPIDHELTIPDISAGIPTSTVQPVPVFNTSPLLPASQSPMVDSTLRSKRLQAGNSDKHHTAATMRQEPKSKQPPNMPTMMAAQSLSEIESGRPKFFKYDKIVSHRVASNNRVKYQLKWANFSKVHNTYVLREQLEDAGECLEEYIMSAKVHLQKMPPKYESSDDEWNVMTSAKRSSSI